MHVLKFNASSLELQRLCMRLVLYSRFFLKQDADNSSEVSETIIKDKLNCMPSDIEQYESITTKLLPQVTET